jgi:capsule polysaccharide export protein KpsE/RkpR
LEQQLVNAKNSLNEAEEDLKIFQQKNKAFDVGEQGKASIETIANLQAQLVANEIRLATLSQRMTESNPEIRSTKSTIDQIKYQISEMEGQGGSSAIPSVGSMPSIGQQYGRLLRELKVRAAVVELLTSQYEMAHLAEANYVAGLRIVQQAQVPEKKLRPRRTRIVLLSTYMAFIFSVLGSFFQERVACLPPERKERWRSLGYRLRGR